MIVVGVLQFGILLLGLVRAKGIAFFLGPEGVGVVGTIDQLVVTLAQISALGIPYTAMKFMSSAHSRSEGAYLRAYTAFGRIMLFLTLLAGLVAVCVLAFLPGIFGATAAQYQTTLFIAIFGVPALMMMIFLPQVLAASQRSRDAITLSLVYLSLLTISALTGAAFFGTRGLYLATTITGTGVVIAALAHFNKAYGLKLFGESVSLRDLITNSPIVLRTAFAAYSSLVAYAFCLLLVRFAVLDALGGDMTGYLQAALSIALSVGSILAVMNSLQLAPTLNREASINDKVAQAQSFANKIALLLLAGAVPIALFPGLTLTILYTGAFIPAAAALVLCLIWQGIYQLTIVYQQLLIGLNHLLYMAFAIIFGYAISGCLVFVLIDPFGILAAPLALIAGTLVSILLNIARLVWKEGMRFPWPVFARFGLALVMVGVAGALFAGKPELSLEGGGYRLAYLVVTYILTWSLMQPEDKAMLIRLGRRCSKIVCH